MADADATALADVSIRKAVAEDGADEPGSSDAAEEDGLRHPKDEL